ncbi:GNAT family N-acetyltransferase [Neobacillus niacini]|uniref:GNAT family N-acetyltransferase n=1 Tax=Neobacillus niacini TaxID=86668 RepID=UPI0007AB3140|nr:GNAT family N-acetyltransferase [Neobacillus niacini]MEC1524657.1 GNAT family N-acetyltransferase [Neobacillus niacini]
MTIRKATYEETQSILNYHLQVLKEATMGYVKPSREKAMEMMTPFLNGGGYYLVRVKHNVIQGWVGLGQIIDQNTDETVGFINEMYVLPPYRKQGAAEKLCKAAFIQLRAEGLRKVQLNVYAGNQAKRLYEKLGFTDVSTLMTKNLN